MAVCLTGDVDGVALNGESGRLALITSKSDSLEDGRVMIVELSVDMVSEGGTGVVPKL